MEIEGEVTSGLGKGSYYMSKQVYQKEFDDKLGFKPFPGTLNLKVKEKLREKFEANGDTLKIQEVYEDDGERLSNVEITPCKIGDVNCGLLNLEFTEHPKTIAEIVAPVELRKKFDLTDGENVNVTYKTDLSRKEIREDATEATLCFIIRGGKTLLIKKKRGVGKGLFNGPGGKLEAGETPKECAVRETEEEINVTPKEVEKMGELEFIFGEEPFMFVHVFKAECYSGELEESEEARPEWFPTEKLPYDDMWPDDKHWVPKMLEGEKFTARFYFNEDGEEIQSHFFEEPKF